MRFVTILFIFFLFSYITGWAQSPPEDDAETIKPSSYLLKVKNPSGEVISTTGRIMRAIALSRPQSLEIARIYLNYTASVKLNTDVSGETTAIVSFRSMKLSGDVVYKGFNIENQIFPSLVTFRLILPGSNPATVTAKQVLANVSGFSVNRVDCTVSVSLHKKVTVIPVIDKLAFFHSEDDYKMAEAQMKLIDRYNVAGWVMKRTEDLLDSMQLSQLNDPAAFLASNLEVIVLNDWMIRQHFNRYPVFQLNDPFSLAKRLVINKYRKKLIDQDFIKKNVIRNEDLLKAANLFSVNLANYFDTSQPDLIRATYLSQMAGSRMSTIGYRAIRTFADDYAAVHKHCKIDWRLFVSASTMIRHAMTEHASLLADTEQPSEAMGLLNASDNYALQKGNDRSPADSILIGKLSQRLYDAYLDFAIKSVSVGIYRVTNDCYQNAILLKQNSGGLIIPDSRERYVADMICKAMLVAAAKSFASNDVESALETYAQAIRLAESARLKNAYEAARIRMEAISNRPSGFKPWEGASLAVIIPAKETAKAKIVASTVPDKTKLKEKASAVAALINAKKSIITIKKSGIDSIADSKTIKPFITKSHAQTIKDSAFLAVVIKRALVKKGIQNSKDSLALADIDNRIHQNQLNNDGKESTDSLTSIKKQILENIARRNTKDSLLLAANSRNLKVIQLKLSVFNKQIVLSSIEKKSITDKPGQAITDSTAVLAKDILSVPLPKKVPQTKNIKIKKELSQFDSEKAGNKKLDESLSMPKIKQLLSEYIKRLHLEIWSGDTVNSAGLLNKSDSLQQLLTLAGDQGFASDLRVLRITYEEMCCTQQNKAFSEELVQIRNSLKLNDYSASSIQLKKLIAKTYTASCKVDKSEAIILLSTLESPLAYKKWCEQLDSITITQEPESVIEAFEQASKYYRDNTLDKFGMEPPDLMSALKLRQETSFLLKAVAQMLNTYKPLYALDLLKEIHKLEPEPDKTFTMQKRLGEMLASGDHSTDLSVKDKLKSYDIDDKWYDELTSAYKKQWKMFTK
jgi:hypothetical protein